MFPFVRSFSLTGILSVLSAAVPATTPAQTAAPALSLRPAAEISLPAGPGKVYQMQTSADLSSWQNIGSLIFGTGTPIFQPVAGGSNQFFRVQVQTTPAMGDAPWTPQGSSIQLNEGPRTVRYEFQGNGQGRAWIGTSSYEFTWTWMRHGLSRARAEITLSGTPTPGIPPREVIELTYVAAEVGQFIRRCYTGLRQDNTDSGSFGPAPSATSTLVPASILGRTAAFSESPSGNALTLTTPDSGLRLMDGTSTSFNGSWQVTGNATAGLIARYGTTRREEYSFSFTSPLSGRYTRRTFTEGVFRDHDQGTFCLSATP